MNAALGLWNSAADAWWGWMSAACWQAAVVVALAAVVERLLAWRGRAEWAAALWALAFAKCLLPPTLTAPWSVARVAPALVAEPAQMIDASGPAARWLMALWLAGVVLLLITWAWRHARLRRQWLEGAIEAPPWLRARCARAAARLGLRKAPSLRLSSRVEGIAVVGLWRPTIVAPRRFLTELTRAELDAVLLHELAHVRRRDAWRAAAALALQIAYWFHPAAWLIRRRLEALREIACDARAATALGDRRQYARALVRVAESRWPAPAPGLALLRRRRQLVERLERLTADSRRRRWTPYLVAAVFGVVCLPLGSAWQAPAPPALAQITPSDASSAALAADDPGCLRLRMQVYAALAQEQAPSGPVY